MASSSQEMEKKQQERAGSPTLTRTSTEEVLQEEEGKTQEETRPPLYGAGFWDHDMETSRHRAVYLKTMLAGGLLTVLVIFSYLAIYWGSLWKVNEKIHNMNGWIVVSLRYFPV